MKTDGGNVTMTTTGGNLLASDVSTSIVWNDVGDSVELVYTGVKWAVALNKGAYYFVRRIFMVEPIRYGAGGQFRW